MSELPIVHADAVETNGADLRTGYEGLQEGVLAAGDLKVVAGAANLTVDVPAGVAYVQGDSIPDQGLYRCRNDATKNSAAFELGGVAAAHATLPRIDQIVARAYDHAADASGLRKWRFEVIQGTATSGATLDNRNGAASLPSSAVRIADLLVPAAHTGVFVTATHLRDRRPWALGANARSLQSGAANYTTTSTSLAVIDATNLKKRIECSGKPLRVRLFGMGYPPAAGNTYAIGLEVDGASLGPAYRQTGQGSSTYEGGALLDYEYAPAAGSHTFQPMWLTSTGTANLERSATAPLIFKIEEILRQEASND